MAKNKITSEEFFNELMKDTEDYASFRYEGKKEELLKLADEYWQSTNWTKLCDKFKSEKARQKYWNIAQTESTVYQRLRYEGIYYFVGKAIIGSICGMFIAMEEGKNWQEIIEMIDNAMSPIWASDKYACLPRQYVTDLYNTETKFIKESAGNIDTTDNAGV